MRVFDLLPSRLGDGALVRADPSGAATTGWELVAGIGSIFLGMVFLGSLVLMLGIGHRRAGHRPGEVDHRFTAARALFDAKR